MSFHLFEGRRRPGGSPLVTLSRVERTVSVHQDPRQSARVVELHEAMGARTKGPFKEPGYLVGTQAPVIGGNEVFVWLTFTEVRQRLEG